MMYVTYDGSGNLTGGFNQVLNPAHASNYFEVDAAHLTNWTSYKYVNGALEAITPTIDHAAGKANAIKVYRVELERLINQLTGIGFVALATGNSSAVSDVLTIRQLLVDIATRPAVVSATTYAQAAAALQAEYADIVAITPQYIKDQII